MKNLSSWRAALLMLAPLVVLIGMVFMPMGCGGGSSSSGPAPTPVVTNGNVAVAFANTPNKSFQSILFNVASVRLNPSANPSVSDFDAGWVTLSVPSGVGLNSGATTDPFLALSSFFNTTNPSTTPGNAGTGPSELQVDTNQFQGSAQLFNTVQVPVNVYQQVEVVLDLNAFGYVTPLCSGGPAEGCIQYPMALATGGQLYPRTSAIVNVTSPSTTTLVINLNAGTITPPATSTGSFTTNPTITVNVNNTSGANAGSLAQVNGPITGATTVTAELSGTDQVVATTSNASGNYLLLLPATAAGTPYDIVASGANATFDTVRDVVLGPGQQVPLTLASTTTGNVNLSGTISDACSTLPVQGATVDILAPPTINSTANCITTPTQCVVVASGQSQDTGVYPMPGSNYFTPPFTNMPDGNYAIRVSAAGYDTVVSSLSVSGSGASCGSGSGGVCNFALTSSTMGGTVSVSPGVAPGSPPLNVMVMAEDHGTNNIENVATTAIQPGGSTAQFSMKVPTSSTVSAFDVFSSVQDTFNGAPETFSGHTIGVASNLLATTACTPFSIPTGFLSAMQCVGHGSILGTVSSGAKIDDFTTIELSKAATAGGNVAFSAAQVSPLTSLNPNQFSFCAPADSALYTVQRFEAGPGTAPVPAASPTSFPMATPTLIPGTCPTICSNGSGACTVCTNTSSVTAP